MARIRNNPARYATRDAKLPATDPNVNTCKRRVEERKRRLLDAPIDGNFYVDLRKPANT